MTTSYGNDHSDLTLLRGGGNKGGRGNKGKMNISVKEVLILRKK